MEEATRRALEDARRLLDVAATDVDVAPLLAHLVADLDAIVSRHRDDRSRPASGRAAQEQHLRELLSSSDGGVEASAKGVVDLLWCTLEQAPLAILALDEQARVRLWNPGCERLFGWSAEEALGGPPPFVGPEHAAAFRTNFERVRAGESLAGVEIERRARDGRTLELQFWTAALHAASGTFLGLLGMVADISQLKELERLRVEWAAVVAHDLRAPIGTIGMAAQLLSRLEGPDAAARGQRALEHIRNAVARLNRMVDDLSDVSKLEAHRLDVRRHRVELVALTRDAAERVADLTPGLQVEVRATAPVEASVDPTRIEQVVCNLLTNAARHGDPSAVVVVDVLDRGHEAELVVTNRGPGLLPDELPHVFERFARSRRSRDRHVPGLGLGLYISRGLVEAHGGRIWVESTPGETTRFHVVLPRA